MKKLKKSYNIIFKNFIRILAIILCVFYVVNSNLSYIKGGIMFLITSIGVDMILKLIKINLTNLADFILQGFIFLALFVRNMCNIYTVFPWWDLFLHFVSGILIGIVGLCLLRFLVTEELFESLSAIFKAIYSFMIVTASSSIWEMIEFAGDKLLGFNSQLNSLLDTMGDIYICVLGGGIISIIIYKFYKKNKFKFIGRIVEVFSIMNVK